MKFVFLHGPPAVGKLTIARELAERTGFRLFHNHLTLDLVLAVYDFGTPGFIALREEIWLATIRRALADRLPGLIFTFSPEDSVPQRFIDDLFREITARDGTLISVELTASETTIERRMASESRHKFRKLVDLELYRKLRDTGRLSSPVIPVTHLTLDTGALQSGEAVSRIIALGRAF